MYKFKAEWTLDPNSPFLKYRNLDKPVGFSSADGDALLNPFAPNQTQKAATASTAGAAKLVS